MFHERTIIKFNLTIICFVYIARLFYIQIFNNEYKLASKSNTIQKVVEYPYRGEILDRCNTLLVYNEAVYDLMVIPNKVKNIDIDRFCKVFYISKQVFNKKILSTKLSHKLKPSIFIENISHQEFATIQDNLSEYPGFYIKEKTTRGYHYPILSHCAGYLNEVCPNVLKANKYYSIGDKIGANGIEKFYEKELRGKKGVSFKVIDVNGIKKGSYKNGKFDIKSVPGKNLYLTIDINLQSYANSLMKNKKGSIVAIEPKTGEILLLASYPYYDSNILKGKNLKINFTKLQNDKNCPLFVRPYMAQYPPGSIFKIVQALIALEEGIITPEIKIPCNKKLVKCHRHKSPSDLHSAIKNSCNPYYYVIFQKLLNQNIANSKYLDARIGLQKWNDYVKEFGFGNKLLIDLPGEKAGFMPNISFYDKLYGKYKWKSSTIRSLDIGQGEMLVTPLQMANLAAIIGNKGYYYRPHIVKKIGNKKLKFPRKEINIKDSYFTLIYDAMAATTRGTAWRAYIENLEICCKTGTAENPGNDHSVFIGFAPKEDPKIAIAVYVENAGWGSYAATLVGSLVIEKYLNKKISKKRKYLEKEISEYSPNLNR